MMFTMGLSHMAFFMLMYVSSVPTFWRRVLLLLSLLLLLFCFNHKWVLNFVKGFLCIYCNNHVVFIFLFTNMVYHIDWFANIEEFLHLWKSPLDHDIWSFKYVAGFCLLNNFTMCLETQNKLIQSKLEKEWNWRDQPFQLHTILQSYSHQDCVVLAKKKKNRKKKNQWNRI